MIERTVSTVLTDIEGTTTDIAFVHRVLFPYSLKHMAEFVVQNASQPEVARQLGAVATEIGCAPQALDKIVNQLENWIDEDVKATPLKALQGLIWRQGYADGNFTGHIYADAHTQMAAWHKAGISLAIFSSGSVGAQKLLFGHSDFGDLTPWFSHYFDTTTGPKRESASYQRISSTLGGPVAAQLFLSDVVEELDAAAEAGMQTIQLVRSDGMTTGAHPIAHSFDDIQLRLAA